MAKRRSAVAFLSGLNSSASTGIRGFGEGLLRAHTMRQEEAAALRAERHLEIAQAQEGRAAELFPLALRAQELEIDEAEGNLEAKKSERMIQKRDRAKFESATRDLQGKLTDMLASDPKAQLSRADVAEIAAKHNVSPSDLTTYLGQSIQQAPSFQEIGPGTTYGSVDPTSGLFSAQGVTPFAPRGTTGGAGGRGSELAALAPVINALVNVGEFAQGGKGLDPMQALMFSIISDKLSPGSKTGLEGLMKQAPQGDPGLLGMVQNELRGIFTPALQYDIDPESGEGILFNPASGDTLFGGR